MVHVMSRRNFLKNSAITGGLAAAYATLPAWMPRVAFAQPYNNPRGDVLISIFLRGGADALNMIVPYADDLYYAARPQLAIPRPDTTGTSDKVRDLDGFFGLHPALAALDPIFRGGQMAAIHAVGSPHETRSHFEAMDYMERGTPGSYDLQTGWIARHLRAIGSDEHDSPVRGVGWGTALPQALSGAPSTVAMRSIIDYHLGGDERRAEAMMQSLMGLYQLEDNGLSVTAESTQAAISVLQQVGYERYMPQHGADYGDDDFSMALRQTAALIRADVGLEAACIDLGGWDTHANQGGVEGTQARLMQNLADGLAAFHQDMGPDMAKVTLVVMSEFGRRVEENASQGTDHGRAGSMLVMSGNLATTQPVVANWPGLAPDMLEDGDLAVTLDYRDILTEILTKRLKNDDVASVFPTYAAQTVSLMRE